MTGAALQSGPVDENRRDARGFTLVEVLIVCGILLLLLSLSLPAFSSMIRGHRMTGGTRSIEGAFLQARGAAISGRGNWKIDVDLAANEIRFFAAGAPSDVRTIRFDSPLRLSRTTAPQAALLSYLAYPDGTIECASPPDIPSSAFDASPGTSHDFLLLQEGGSRMAFDVVPVTGRVRGRRVE